MRNLCVKNNFEIVYARIMSFLLFCILFILLFLFSRRLTQLLSKLLMQVFHHTGITIHILSFFFLPGVILHELSHLLMASVLFVPTGEVEFFPEVHGNEVKMGSVAVAKTDPLRRFLIGVAPVIGGLGIILLSSLYLTSLQLISWQNILLLYIVFEISNTMFSSSKDMEGALGFVVAVVVVAIILQAIRLPVLAVLLAFFQNATVLGLFSKIDIFLIIALGINIFFLLLFEGISRVF